MMILLATLATLLDTTAVEAPPTPTLERGAIRP